MQDLMETETLLNTVIGQPYSEPLRAQLEARTGRPVRPVGAGFYSPHDLGPHRIRLNLREDRMIESYSFGE